MIHVMMIILCTYLTTVCLESVAFFESTVNGGFYAEEGNKTSDN